MSELPPRLPMDAPNGPRDMAPYRFPDNSPYPITNQVDKDQERLREEARGLTPIGNIEEDAGHDVSAEQPLGPIDWLEEAPSIVGSDDRPPYEPKPDNEIDAEEPEVEIPDDEAQADETPGFHEIIIDKEEDAKILPGPWAIPDTLTFGARSLASLEQNRIFQNLSPEERQKIADSLLQADRDHAASLIAHRQSLARRWEDIEEYGAETDRLFDERIAEAERQQEADRMALQAEKRARQESTGQEGNSTAEDQSAQDSSDDPDDRK